MPESPAAATGAWTLDGTFAARISFHETPFVLAVTLRFSLDEVRCDAEWNVAFGPTREPTLVGKAE